MNTSSDDEVVLDYPVFVCSDLHGSTTHLALLHHPLRPPWRPYDYGKLKQMRMKPKAMKLEVDVPVSQTSNYNEDIEEFKKINKITLRSQQVEPTTSFAVGTLQDGKFLLMPVDYSLHLRPTLSHLNVGNISKRSKEDADEDSDDEPVMRAVEVSVQVQKRETERQQQARLNSYAHLSAKEEEEPWTNLVVHNADSAAAASVWSRFASPKESNLAAGAMNKSSYLRAFVPSQGGSGLVSGAAVADAELDTQHTSHSNLSLNSSQIQSLGASLRSLHSKHSVCNMANIRQWLQDPASGIALSKDVTEKTLHDAILSTGLVICIRRCYMLQSTGNPQTDPFRLVLLNLLKDRETFKRAEVLEAAQLQNIVVSDVTYNKVIKDVCQSRGVQWLLKSPSLL